MLVDADACPVKDEVLRVAERYGCPVTMVSNQGVRAATHPLVRAVLADGGWDAADDWIAEHARPGDVVVTADVPLAARCLEAGAAVLGPTGRPFTRQTIGMALAMRDLNRHLRETGEGGGGPGRFTKSDRSAFLGALDRAVKAARTPRAGD
ncbi:MAG: YaiI/YqxD family protein [Azospirillaceae bacterium]